MLIKCLGFIQGPIARALRTSPWMAVPHDVTHEWLRLPFHLMCKEDKWEGRSSAQHCMHCLEGNQQTVNLMQGP